MKLEELTREQLLHEVQTLQARLARSEADCLHLGRHQALFDNALNGILVADDRACFVDANPAAGALLGYCREELLGLSVWDITPAGSREAGQRQWAQFLGQGTQSGEYTVVRKDGAFREVEYQAVAHVVPGVHVTILRDITERNRLQAERDRLLGHLRLQIDRLPLAYLLLDADCRVLDWNRTAERMFGYTKAEALGQVCLDLILAMPLSSHIQQILQRIEAGDMEAHSVNENRTKDGRTVTCQWFNTPLKDANGRFAGLVALGQDITERQRIEAQLRESEERFQQLAGNIEGYFWLNAPDDSRMYYISPGWEKLTGQSVASLYRRPESWGEIVHPDDRERVARITAAPIETERRVEYRIIRPDGEVRWIRDRAFPVRNEAGEVYRVAGIGEDITERVRAAQQVARSRDFYLTLLDHFPTPVWRSDKDGKCDYLNQTWLSFTGRSREQELGDGWVQAAHPDDRDRCLATFLGELAARRPFKMQYRLRRHDGVYRWVEDHGRPFDDLDGEFAGYIGACYDVTEQVEAAGRQREYSESLQLLSRRLLAVQEDERRGLARELHDEVGQTLTSLKFAVEAGAALPREQSLVKLGEARALIDEALTRIRDLSFDLRPGLLDHLGLVPALLSLCQRFARQTEMVVSFRHAGLENRVDPEVETAAYRVVQEALTNVARHAGVNEAAVRVWVDGALTVQVEDQGVGFDPEAVLARAKSMGLVGMHERVRLLGGRLTIESTPGSGTHVRAELPLSGGSAETHR